MRVIVNGEAREISSQSVDALLAVHHHAHCITSLSIWPRST